MRTYFPHEIHRGELYYADLRPVVGSEQGGIRPVLILQNNMGNRHSPTSCSCYKQDGESEAAHPCKPKQALEWPALWFYNSFGATPYH